MRSEVVETEWSALGWWPKGTALRLTERQPCPLEACRWIEAYWVALAHVDDLWYKSANL